MVYIEKVTWLHKKCNTIKDQFSVFTAFYPVIIFNLIGQYKNVQVTRM